MRSKIISDGNNWYVAGKTMLHGCWFNSISMSTKFIGYHWPMSNEKLFLVYISPRIYNMIMIKNIKNYRTHRHMIILYANDLIRSDPHTICYSTITNMNVEVILSWFMESMFPFWVGPACEWLNDTYPYPLQLSSSLMNCPCAAYLTRCFWDCCVRGGDIRLQ